MANGVLESREALASYPDRVLAYRWSTSAGLLSDMLISLESPHPNSVTSEGPSLKMFGQLPTSVDGEVLYETERGLRFQEAIDRVGVWPLEDRQCPGESE